MNAELEVEFDMDLGTEIDSTDVFTPSSMDAFYDKEFFFSYSSRKLLMYNPPTFAEKYINNIYEERYMGLPQDNNKEDYIKASAINYAKGLKGNLLIIHGTGDDNVHYQNTEMLINELVKNNKQFSMMSYPNRTHSISEGRGTSAHLYTLITNYINRC